MNLYLSHSISRRLIPEINGGVRARTSIHNTSDMLPSEEAYFRGNTGLAIKILLLSDISAKVIYNYKSTNFEDFDPYDWNGHELSIKTDIRLLPGATMSVQYSREKMQFSKWDDARAKREDILGDTSISIQSYSNMLVDISYSHQNNRSNLPEYSYTGNKLAIMLAKSLPENAIIQVYAVIKSEKYKKQIDEIIPTHIELDDDERKMAMLKLSKEINELLSLEAQYDLKRNQSKLGDGFYTKNVFSVSAHVSF